MRNNRIGLKLGMVIMSLFLVVLVSLGFVMDRLFTNFYYAEMKNDVEELTAHFVTMAETRETSTAEMLQTLAEFSNVSIFFVDSVGNMIAHSGEHDPTDHDFIKVADRKRLQTGQALNTEHIDPQGNRYFVSARSIPQGNPLGSAIYVLSSTKNMDHSLAAVRNLLLLSGVGAFLLALGITLVIAQLLSRPLLNMQKATRTIAKGNLETRLEIHSKDEIGMLSAAINDLAKDLQRYRDTRQEFFANISHELRTPITYLEGYSKVLSDGIIESEEDKQKYLDIIHQEARRLQLLVEDLFELSKIEEGRISLSLEWIDLIEVVDRGVGKAELKAGEKGLELVKEISRPIPLIYADGLRMEQILLNILENAIRYTDQGRITVSLSGGKDSVILFVEDTGIGISEEEIPYIFDRFYRVEKSRSRQFGGTGLGLSIVQKLTEMQGGSIRVTSNPGSGTRMELVFPITEAWKEGEE